MRRRRTGDGGPETVATKKQGWIRRLVGYMKPHKKNAYIAFGVAIGGQLIQSLLPLVQKVVVDDVITPQTKAGHPPGKPLAPWLTLMIVMGVATFIFAYFRRFRGGRIALDVQHDLRTAIFAPAPAPRLREPRRARDRSAREPRVVRRRARPGLPAVPARSASRTSCCSSCRSGRCSGCRRCCRS